MNHAIYKEKVSSDTKNFRVAENKNILFRSVGGKQVDPISKQNFTLKQKKSVTIKVKTG